MVLGSRIRTGRGRGAALALAGALVLGPALAACSDDSGGAGTNPPTPASRTPSATAPADPAAARKEIKENWEKFFDPAVSLKEKEAVLENGQQMRQVLQGFNGDQRGQQVSADVTKVTFTSPTGADVTYSLSLKGATVLPDAKGTSVEQDGTWKVSVKTLCALVQLSENASAAPGC
ncbi:hypothetical protein [Streptomyces sp. NPDC050145]|uniref:hypothetical protein n=1 Tax=Streptomyces sp. NPDC050145 TaxID=3365602 RepID=UPI0037B5A146